MLRRLSAKLGKLSIQHASSYGTLGVLSFSLAN